MRKRRFTYKGAIHHVMNHSIDDIIIFPNKNWCNYFISLIKKYSNIYDIRIYAYCIMKNHYHIILENTSGNMPAFKRVLESTYALNFNKHLGRKGSLFYDRYRSTIIENDQYLTMAILYVLLNPERKGIVEDAHDYRYSSIHHLFSDKKNDIIDYMYVENLFMNEDDFNEQLSEWSSRDKLPEKKYKHTFTMGNEGFHEKILERIDSRDEGRDNPGLRKRKTDKKKPLWKVATAFSFIDRKYSIDIKKANFNNRVNRRARLELLQVLRDNCGLTYKEIILLKPFKELKYKSLSRMYGHVSKSIINRHLD